jgi:UDP-2,4-diacetamido-2,4,6-trideoxy-beta-L-altropyranose hydrolase
VKPSIAFRVDSGGKIGTGHVMRCLTLARALRDSGAESLFICRPTELSCEHLITKAGFPVAQLPQGHSPNTEGSHLMHGDFLASSQAEDALACVEILRVNKEVRTIIADHYGIYRPWDEIIAPHVKIFKIDDIADREHLCQGLLDQNFYVSMASRYTHLIPKGGVRLFGPTYSLLRRQFRDVDITSRGSSVKARRVLVSFGGNDPNGHCHQIAQTILEGTDLSVMIMSAMDPRQAKKWEALLSKFPDRLEHLGYVSDPLPALQLADLYIGAGGTITWERFACGLPGIVYSIADNQIQMARDLETAGFQDYAGSINNYFASSLLKLVHSLLDAGRLGMLANKIRGEVDGHGAKRVIEGWNLLSLR